MTNLTGFQNLSGLKFKKQIQAAFRAAFFIPFL